jgi:hypothetical protein
MTETYQYKKQIVTVGAIQGNQADQTKWERKVAITGSQHVFSLRSRYPPRTFPTSEAAIRYGKEAAEYAIDNPPAIEIIPEDLL